MNSAIFARNCFLLILVPLICGSVNAQSPYKDSAFDYDPQANGSSSSKTSCAVKNKSDPNDPPCTTCDACPTSGDDTGSGGSGSGESNQGPSPHQSPKNAIGELEAPKTVIVSDHGGAWLRTTDLKIPGSTSGIPLEFARYYNSRDAETSGDLMGHGRTWSHSWS